MIFKLKRRIPRSKIYLEYKDLYYALKETLFNFKDKKSLVKQFENVMADYVGVKHAFAMAHGRQALYFALSILKNNGQNELIMPAYTCRVVVPPVIYNYIKPVFADINPNTFNMEPDNAKPLITKNTRFILMTHIHGRAADVIGFKKLCNKHSLFLIEDAAAAIGLKINKKMAGSFGDMSIMSFSLYKNLNTLDGGMLFTDKDNLAKKIKTKLKNSKLTNVSHTQILNKLVFGLILKTSTDINMFSNFTYPILKGIHKILKVDLEKWMVNLDNTEISSDSSILNEYNHNLTEFQAAVGLTQINRVKKDNEVRIENSKYLHHNLQKNNIIKSKRNFENDICLNYILKAPEPQKLKQRLFDKGIDTLSGFLEDCSAAKPFKTFSRSCKEASKLSKQKLYLPVHHPLNINDMELIVKEITDYYNK